MTYWLTTLVWFSAAFALTRTDHATAFAVLFIGGMLIFPVSTLIDKLVFRRSGSVAGNPLGLLALESTIAMIGCLLAAWLSLTMSEIRGLTKSRSVQYGQLVLGETVVRVNRQDVHRAHGKEENRLRMLTIPPYIARLIERYHWIGWIGLALIFYVAMEMIISGGRDVVPLIPVQALESAVASG